MSIKIKTGVMEAKQNGTLKNIDMLVGDSATAINEIRRVGNEVLESIPADYSNKTEKKRIDFDGTQFTLDGQVLNYQQLHDIHLTSPDFAFIVYGDRAYLLSYVQDNPNAMREMRFQSVIATTDATSNLSYSKTGGIYVRSTNGVTIAGIDIDDINSENKGYKASEITDENKDSDVWYPSMKVVNDVTEPLSTEVSQLSESITEISDYDKNYYMFLSPMYVQAHLLDFAKTLGLEDGKYVSYINGSDGVNKDWVATKYIPILSTNIRYRIVAVRDIMFALYDENLNFVFGRRVMNTWYLNQDTIPTNAKYLRFSTYKSDYDKCEFTQWQDPMATKFDIGENVKVPYSNIIDAPHYDVVKETVVNVSDYTNLRECLESIQPNEKNHYIVEIPNGTYDIKSMYTEAERNVSGFRGLFVPDFTVLKGTGNKEDTIIRYDNSESETISQNISTLHFRNWVEMENITVIGTRIRYAVHDDFPSTDVYNHRFIKNCEFKVFESYYNDAYGSGQTGGADWTFENCTFDVASVNTDFGTSDYLRSFSNHASTNQVRSSKFKFINCDFKSVNTSIVGVRLTSMSNGSTALNYATMIGCRVNGRIRLEAENTSYGKANKFKLNGFANGFGNSDVTVYFTDGVDYSSYVDLH